MKTYVYTARAADGSPLYVGCSNNVGRRMHDHRDMPWMRHTALIEWDEYPTRAEALRVEAERIATERPLFNKRGNPDFYAFLRSTRGAPSAWHPLREYAENLPTVRAS